MKQVDLAVIGGGPAGLSAAITASEAGAGVALFDEQPELGGQLRYRVIEAGWPALPAFRLGHQLRETASRLPIDLECASIVWGLFPDRELAVRTPNGSYRLRARQIVIATGATDRAFICPGATLPGVFTARALQLLINRYRVLPGERVAIIGSGPLVDELANDISYAGGRSIVPIDPETAVEIAIIGSDRVEGIRAGNARYRVETVVIATGRVPDIELPLMLGCQVGFEPAYGGFVPIRDEWFQSSIPGVFVIGDAAGICSIDDAMTEGRIAGLNAAAAIGLPVRRVSSSDRRSVEPVAVRR
jgi:sarcosine oxidase subunit alpha